jgi:hypothetical protein
MTVGTVGSRYYLTVLLFADLRSFWENLTEFQTGLGPELSAFRHRAHALIVICKSVPNLQRPTQTLSQVNNYCIQRIKAFAHRSFLRVMFAPSAENQNKYPSPLISPASVLTRGSCSSACPALSLLHVQRLGSGESFQVHHVHTSNLRCSLSMQKGGW